MKKEETGSTEKDTPGNLPCELCGHTFGSYKSLKKHIIYTHNVVPYSWKVCRSKLRNEYQAFDHIKRRHPDFLSQHSHSRELLLEPLPTNTAIEDVVAEPYPTKRQFEDTNSLSYILRNKSVDDTNVFLKIKSIILYFSFLQIYSANR